VDSVCRVKRFRKGVDKGGKRCADDEVGTEVRDVAETTGAGFDALVKRWDKRYQCWWRICREINVSPLQVRILHVLLFISIRDLFIDSALYIVL
jgi:hypothetical protein